MKITPINYATHNRPNFNGFIQVKPGSRVKSVSEEHCDEDRELKRILFNTDKIRTVEQYKNSNDIFIELDNNRRFKIEAEKDTYNLFPRMAEYVEHTCGIYNKTLE